MTLTVNLHFPTTRFEVLVEFGNKIMHREHVLNDDILEKVDRFSLVTLIYFLQYFLDLRKLGP